MDQSRSSYIEQVREEQMKEEKKREEMAKEEKPKEDKLKEESQKEEVKCGKIEIASFLQKKRGTGVWGRGT